MVNYVCLPVCDAGAEVKDLTELEENFFFFFNLHFIQKEENEVL